MNGELVKYTGTVRQAMQGFGYIKYLEPGSETDKRIVFNAIDVMNQLELKSGDEVSFVHTKGPKLREDLARKVIRFKEAPIPPPQSEQKSAVKTVSNSVPQPVRTPAMPDGTRGFQMGRGGKLPAPLPTAVATPPPGTLF